MPASPSTTTNSISTSAGAQALAEAAATARRRHAEIVEAVIAGNGADAETRMSGYLHEVAEWFVQHRGDRTGPRRAAEPGPPVGARAKLAEVVAARIHDDIAAQGWAVGTVLGSEAELLTATASAARCCGRPCGCWNTTPWRGCGAGRAAASSSPSPSRGPSST